MKKDIKLDTPNNNPYDLNNIHKIKKKIIRNDSYGRSAYDLNEYRFRTTKSKC